MKKITKLEKEITALKERRIKLQEELKNLDKQEEDNKQEIAKLYEEFFTEKRNKEFILYDKFPSINSLDLYLHKISEQFPLHPYGYFNAKELAEIIKHIYQYKTGNEYKILTIGATEIDASPVYGGQVYRSVPHLYFMIGNNKTLMPYKEYNGLYWNEDKLHTRIYLNGHKKDLITIETNNDERNSLGIECLTGNFLDEKGKLNYYNQQYSTYFSSGKDINKQIFARNIISNLYSYKDESKGIKDVLDFKIHQYDTYIAKILISIAIYKKNNNILTLKEEDYNHIFEVLFNDKPPIIKDIEKDFPKQLIYVPNKKTNK